MTSLSRRKLTRSPVFGNLENLNTETKPVKTKKAILPPKVDNKLTVIFDLDETLIHTHINDKNYSSDVIRINVDSKDYIVSVRPGVRNLLKRLAGKCELILFTASEKQYASQIIAELEKDSRIFDYKLYQSDCKIKFGRVFKDLSKIGRDNTNTIIFDDSLDVWRNEESVFKCKQYNGGNDDEEIDKIQHVIDAVIQKQNVKEVLGEQNMRLI